MKITVKGKDINDILHTFRYQELSQRLQYVVYIVFIGRDFHYKAIQHFRFSFTELILNSLFFTNIG